MLVITLPVNPRPSSRYYVNTDELSELFCRWTSCMEQFACRLTTRDTIQCIQAATQNNTVQSEERSRRIVTFC